MHFYIFAESKHKKMKNELSPEILDDLKRIGIEIKKLRKERTELNYKTLGHELPISGNTYHRIEKGDGDYTIGSLLSVIRFYDDVKLSDILKKIGL